MRDKQIEEMAIALTESQHEFDKAWKECLHNNGKQPERENVFYAKYLVENKGYRKASDVARKIFEEIEKALDNSVETEHFKGTWFNFSKFKQRLAELKKKYESEENKI